MRHRKLQQLVCGHFCARGEGAATEPRCGEVESETRKPVTLGSSQVCSRDGEIRSLCSKPQPGFSMQILAVSSRREAGGQCLAEAPRSGWCGGGLLPVRCSPPPSVHGPSRALGGSYLLPMDSSHGRVGTRPGWASGARLGILLASADLGAGAQGVPRARAPRPLTAHSPQAQRRLSQLLLSPELLRQA